MRRPLRIVLEDTLHPTAVWMNIKCLFGSHHEPIPDGRCSWCGRQTR